MAKGKYEYWLTPEGLLLLEGWARKGLTDEQIAKNIGINVKTLWTWKNAYRPICNALKKGKEIVDFEVENAILKRALGFSYDEVRKIYDEDGKLAEEIVTTKTVPPDATSLIFWLKNRMPKEWRDRPAPEGKPDNGILLDLISELQQ